MKGILCSSETLVNIRFEKFYRANTNIYGIIFMVL